MIYLSSILERGIADMNKNKIHIFDKALLEYHFGKYKKKKKEVKPNDNDDWWLYWGIVLWIIFWIGYFVLNTFDSRWLLIVTLQRVIAGLSYLIELCDYLITVLASKSDD